MVLDNAYNAQRGVTLIELIVVVGIFAVVASVLLFNFSDFSTNVSIRNLTEEVALSVRKAQTYATSVQSIGTINTSTTSYPAYGVSFAISGKTVSDVQTGGLEAAPAVREGKTPRDESDTGSVSAPSSKQFVLFADVPASGNTIGDRLYQDGGSCGSIGQGNECLESFTIKSADRIVAICTDITGCNTRQVNIIFRRPTPDADICIVEGGRCRNDKPSYVKIMLQSAKGLQRTVSVWNTGQISVQ